MKESKKYKLNVEDGKKIWKGAIIAIGGAALTYASQVVMNVEWGEWTPAVVAMSSILINSARKVLRGQK